MTNLIQPDPDLVKKMNRLGEYHQLLEYRRLADGRDVVELTFSAFTSITDPLKRSEALEDYAEIFVELVPRMVEKLPYPLVFKKARSSSLFEEACAVAINTALTHVRSVLEGTHHFSEKLEVNKIGGSPTSGRYLNRGVIRLLVCRAASGKKSVTVSASACLYDRRMIVKGLLLLIDSDPRHIKKPT